MLANDDHTVALMHVTAERNGKTLDMSYALIFHIEDGRIVEGWDIWTDQSALDEFWS